MDNTISIQDVAKEKHEQILFYKTAKNIANQLLQENIDAKGKRRSKWESRIIENNIAQLRNQIKLVNNARKPDSLDKLFGTINEFGLPKKQITKLELEFAKFQLLFAISRHSISYSVVYDMYWNTEGTVSEHLDIALSKKSIKELVKYTPSIIEKLYNEALPFLKSIKEYNGIVTILIDTIQKKELLGDALFNLTIPPIIEGLVRQFAKVVYKRQNPLLTNKEVESYISKFQSLETLINKGNWQPDIKLTFSQAIFRSKYIPHEQFAEVIEAEKIYREVNRDTVEMLLEAQQLVQEIKQDKDNQEKRERIEQLLLLSHTYIHGPKPKDVIMMVSIEIELQFLLRRYKDDRNDIVHGNLADFDHSWKVYTNLSAIYGLYKVIDSYHIEHKIQNGFL